VVERQHESEHEAEVERAGWHEHGPSLMTLARLDCLLQHVESELRGWPPAAVAWLAEQGTKGWHQRQQNSGPLQQVASEKSACRVDHTLRTIHATPVGWAAGAHRQGVRQSAPGCCHQRAVAPTLHCRAHGDVPADGAGSPNPDASHGVLFACVANVANASATSSETIGLAAAL